MRTISPSWLVAAIAAMPCAISDSVHAQPSRRIDQIGLMIEFDGLEVPAVSPSPLASRLVDVRPGDTLSALAARYGVTVRQLMFFNGLPSDRLQVGQSLLVPDQH